MLDSLDLFPLFVYNDNEFLWLSEGTPFDYCYRLLCTAISIFLALQNVID